MQKILLSTIQVNTTTCELILSVALTHLRFSEVTKVWEAN